MKFKEFKYCIIVDEHNRPMTWSSPDRQLCYVDNEDWLGDVLPLKVVSKKVARNQIKKSYASRKSWGMDGIKCKLVPVKV